MPSDHSRVQKNSQSFLFYLSFLVCLSAFISLLSPTVVAAKKKISRRRFITFPIRHPGGTSNRAPQISLQNQLLLKTWTRSNKIFLRRVATLLSWNVGDLIGRKSHVALFNRLRPENLLQHRVPNSVSFPLNQIPYQLNSGLQELFTSEMARLAF